jgi:hypothetical protein
MKGKKVTVQVATGASQSLASSTPRPRLRARPASGLEDADGLGDDVGASGFSPPLGVGVELGDGSGGVGDGDGSDEGGGDGVGVGDGDGVGEGDGGADGDGLAEGGGLVTGFVGLVGVAAGLAGFCGGRSPLASSAGLVGGLRTPPDVVPSFGPESAARLSRGPGPSATTGGPDESAEAHVPTSDGSVAWFWAVPAAKNSKCHGSGFAPPSRAHGGLSHP